MTEMSARIGRRMDCLFGAGLVAFDWTAGGLIEALREEARQ